MKQIEISEKMFEGCVSVEKLENGFKPWRCPHEKRALFSSAIGMVEIIREKHPTTPIGIISPIICPPRENTPNPAGLSLCDMRVELEDAVKRIVETDGDENLFYFTGLDLFGEDLVGPLLPDDLHPNGDGIEIMGESAAKLVV